METCFVFFPRSQTAMEAMGLIAIIVNCYLIGQCGQLQRLFPWLSPEMAIISIVILEVPQLLPARQSETQRRSFSRFPSHSFPTCKDCDGHLTEQTFTQTTSSDGKLFNTEIPLS